MPDFSAAPAFFNPKTGFSTMSGQIGEYALAVNAVTTTGAVWPAANRAVMVAFQLDQPFTVRKMGIQVTTQAGNVDVGIYDEKGNRIVTKGTTATAVAGLQTFDMTASVTGTASPTLNPGTYWIAMASDSGTAAFTKLNTTGPMHILGAQNMNTAFVLPAALTFANPTTNFIPVVEVQGLATL